MSSSTTMRLCAVGTFLIAGAGLSADEIPFVGQELTDDLSSFAVLMDSLDVNTQTSYVWPDYYAGEIDLGGGVIIPYTTEFTSTVWQVTTPYSLPDLQLQEGDMVFAYEITMPFESPGTIETGITEVQINGVMSDTLLNADWVMGMGFSTPLTGVDVPSFFKLDDFSSYGDYGAQAEWEWDPNTNPRHELDNDETIQLLLFTGPSMWIREDIGALIGPFVPGGDDPIDIPLLIPIPAPSSALALLIGAGLMRRR
ncbi:MAG: hypothetical protein ACF8NJ_09645 [Phycisphaerales bacterium JB038]